MAIETMEPIGPVKRVVKDAPITELPKIILGGATLMYNWYNEDPFSVPAVDLVRYAMSQGVNAIDTSPYYDPSEEIYGEVLDTLKDEFPRETYFICTKVGRINLTTFDYSAKHVRFSVLRSCKRLRTDYLDLVYLHDIEFVDYAGIWEALTELRKLKDEGVIRNFGISGYPVDLLQYVSEKCVEKPEIGPLDAVLSYCNMNLQSKVLEDYREKLFENSKLKVICNGSIVGMGLLRSGGPMEAHPCSKELRECSAKAAKYAEENGRNLPDLATRYSIAKWHEKGRTVLGVSNLQELKNALEGYHEVMSNGGHLSAEEESIAAHIQDVCFGPHLNEQWESGIPHKLS